MAQDVTLCVGTVGTGVWLSFDGGESWGQGRDGIFGDARVFSLTVHPHEPHTVLAGIDDGLFCSRDNGKRFERVDAPMNGKQVWRLAVDPVDPQTIFVGTCPSALYRSKDGGQHWEQLQVELAETCPAVRIPRVTSLVVDPSDHRVVWAGIEVDGVRRSVDGGDTWTTINGTINDPDIHDIVVRPSGEVLVSTTGDIFVSGDTGENWRALGVQAHFEFPYCRGLALKADNPDVLFVATGDAAIGSTGAVERSMDGGKSWQRPPLPVEPNTTIWAFATHVSTPNLIAACSHYGELYISEDSGNTWSKTHREFSEIRAFAMMPN